MDIRKFDNKTIVFADSNGGTAKATHLEAQVPCQLKLKTSSGNYVLLHREDFDNFRKALDYAEMFWGDNE